MSPRLRDAAWVGAYSAVVGSIVALAALAPWWGWTAATVLALGAWALRWVLRVPLGGP